MSNRENWRRRNSEKEREFGNRLVGTRGRGWGRGGGLGVVPGDGGREMSKGNREK